MKLHLPKQLFTALLAAITLATPATLTLGSNAWGVTSVTSDTTWSGGTSSDADKAGITIDGAEAHLKITDGEYKSATEKLELKNAGQLTMSGGTLNTLQIHVHNANASTTETLTLTGGTINVSKENTSADNDSTVLIGHWPSGTGKVLVQGGTLNALNGFVTTGWDSHGILEISGTGVVNAKGVALRRYTGSYVKLNGGRLNVGESGIVTHNHTSSNPGNLQFLSGTLGTLSDSGWSLGSNITATIGSIIIDTDVWDATTGATATGDAAGSANISLLGELTAASDSASITLAGSGSLTIDHTWNGTIVKASDTTTAKVLIDTGNMAGFDKLLSGGYGNTQASGFISGYQIYKAESDAAVYSTSDQTTALTITEGVYSVTSSDFHVCDTVNYADINGTVSKFYVQSTGTLNLGELEAVDGVISAVPVPIQNSGNVSIAAGTNGVSLNNLFGTTGITQTSTGTTTISGTGAVSMNDAVTLAGKVVISGGSFTNNGKNLNGGTGGTLVLQGVSSATLGGDRNIDVNIEVGNGTTLTLSNTDAFSWSSGSKLTVLTGGTVDLGRTRQSLNQSFTVEMAGGKIQGEGESKGDYQYGLDFYSGGKIHATENSIINTRVGSNTGTGTITIEVENGKTLTFEGDYAGFSNTMLISKTDTGTLLYKGAAFSNELTISGGVFEYYLAEGTREHSGSISGAGTFKKSGSGTLTLTNASAVNLNVAGGKLVYQIEDNAEADVDQTLDSLVVSSGATFEKSGTGKLNVGNLHDATLGGDIVVCDGVLQFNGYGTDTTTEDNVVVPPRFVQLVQNLTTTGTGKVDITGRVSFNWTGEHAGVRSCTIGSYISIEDDLQINTHGSNADADGDSMCRWEVVDGGRLEVGDVLWLTNRQKLVVDGGSVTAAGGLHLGHKQNQGNFNSKAVIKSGSLTTQNITLIGNNNAVQMTGGTLTFTPTTDGGEVLVDGKTTLSSAGTLDFTGGTLAATTAGWTLTGTAAMAVSLGNVEFDIAAGKTVTLAGIYNLTGTLGLTGNTVTEGETTTTGTLALAGTMTVTCSLEDLKRAESTYTNPDGTTSTTGNGFYTGKYYLVENADAANISTTGLTVMMGSADVTTDVSLSETGKHLIIAGSSNGVFYVNNTAGATTEIAETTGFAHYRVEQGATLSITPGDTLSAANAQNALLTTTGDGTISLNGDLTIAAGSVSQATGKLVINSGATLTMDANSKSSVYDLSSFTSVDLLGGTIKYHGAATTLNNVKVDTEAATLSIEDMKGDYGACETFTLAGTTTLNTALDIKSTNWKYKIAIEKLTGSGDLSFASSSTHTGVKAAVIIDSLDTGYSGTLTATKNSGDAELTLNNLSGTYAATKLSLSNGAVATLSVNQGETATIGGAISGAGSITKLGAGSLTLQNTSTVSNMYMNGGNLTYSGAGKIHTITGELKASGSTSTKTLLTVDAGTELKVGTLNNAWGINLDIDGTFTVSGSLKQSFNNSGLSIDGEGSVSAGSLDVSNQSEFEVGVTTLNVTGGFNMSGAQSKVTFKSGTTTIAGATDITTNSTEADKINQVIFEDGNAVLTGAVSNGAVIKVNSGSVTMNGGISGTGTLALQGGSLTLVGTGNSVGIFEYSGGSLTYESLTAGTANLTSALSNSGHLTVTGSLAGCVANTATGKVTFAKGATIATDTTVSITGSEGTTEFGGTLTNAGTLTLSGKVALSGTLELDYTLRNQAAGSSYVLDKNALDETNTLGDGFRKESGSSYWLIQGGSTALSEPTMSDGYTLTQVTDGNKAEGDTVGDVYFTVASSVGTAFYITSGPLNIVGTGGTKPENTTAYNAELVVLNSDAAVLNLVSGSLNTSNISYSSVVTDDKSGSILLSSGATLNLDTLPGGTTANSLLTSLVRGAEGSTLRIQESGLSTGVIDMTTGDNSTSFAGTLELAAGKDFTFGEKTAGNSRDGNTVKATSLTGIILNEGSTLNYQGSGSDFKNVTVNGSGDNAAVIHIIDGKHDAESNAVKLTGNTTLNHTLNLTSEYGARYSIDNLTGSGTLNAQGGNTTTENFYTTISGLNGFTGTLNFTDTTKHIVSVSTGTTAGSVEFNKLSFVNSSNGSNTFNVQTNTTVNTLTAAAGTVEVTSGKKLTLGGGSAETPAPHSIGTLNADAGTVALGANAQLTLSGGTAEAQKQHSIGTLSAAAAGVTLGDYATLTLGGGTEENPVTHSIRTLTGGTGSYVNLAQHSVLNTITTASGVTLTGSGTYVLASGTMTMTSGVTLGADWTGAVRLSGDINSLNLADSLYNKASWVEFAGVTGYLKQGTNTYGANIRLTDIGENAAITLNNGWNGNTHTFSGKIEGEGTWKRTSSGGTVQNYVFAGDVAGWTGAFVNAIPARHDNNVATATNLTFQGASAINVDISNPGADAGNVGALNVTINDAAQGENKSAVAVNGSIQATKLTVDTAVSADFSNTVDVDTLVVNSGMSATFNNTATAGAVTNAGQIKLGEAATVTGGSMSKVQMSSTGITGTAQDGSSISDADIEIAQLAQDASFTIADMALSNVKLSAVEGAGVALNNLSGKAELAGAGSYNIGTGAAQYTLGMTPAQVGTIENDNGGTALTLSYSSNPSITMSGTGSRLLLSADPTADVNGIFGTYNLTLTLNYTLNGIGTPTTTEDWQVLVGFTGVLGDLLTAQTPEATVDLAEGEAAVAAAGTTPTVEYNYTAPQGDAQVGTLVITINGLNVPEPTCVPKFPGSQGESPMRTGITGTH